MHRIGRTGRFGTDGLAITFVTAQDEHEPDFVRKIEERYEITIKNLNTFGEFSEMYEAMRNKKNPTGADNPEE